MFRDPGCFSDVCKYLWRIVEEGASLDDVIGRCFVGSNLILATDLEVFVGGLIHRDLESGIHRFLYTEHDVEDHIKVLMRRVDIVDWLYYRFPRPGWGHS